MKNKAEIPFIVRVNSADVGGWKKIDDRYVSGDLEVSVTLEEYGFVTRQRTTVKNNGGTPVLLGRLVGAHPDGARGHLR